MSWTLNDLDELFGFPVPESYWRLLQAAEDSGNDYLEPIGIIVWLDRLDDDLMSPAHPPELHKIGSTGTAGFNYAFITDELPPERTELPIVECSYVGVPSEMMGESIPEFVRMLIAREAEDIAEYPKQEVGFRRVVAALPAYITIDPPIGDFDAAQATLQDRRLLTATPTLDGAGIVLPPESVNHAYLDKFEWGPDYHWDSSRALEWLGEAEDRLAAREPGTALVVARNARYRGWYADLKSGARVLRESTRIMQVCYEMLGREFLIERVHRQKEWALQNVR